MKVTIGYWRKANAIHSWFVKNVQGGVDECQESDISRKQLESLRTACRQVLDSVETVDGSVSQGTTYHGDGRVEEHTRPGKVIAQPGIAAKVLPVREGFFFGKTAYDEDYLTDLRETVAIVDKALELKGVDFSYRASW